MGRPAKFPFENFEKAKLELISLGYHWDDYEQCYISSCLEYDGDPFYRASIWSDSFSKRAAIEYHR